MKSIAYIFIGNHYFSPIFMLKKTLDKKIKPRKLAIQNGLAGNRQNCLSLSPQKLNVLLSVFKWLIAQIEILGNCFWKK